MNKLYESYMNFCENKPIKKGHSNLMQTYLQKVCKQKNIVTEQEQKKESAPQIKPIQKKHTESKGEADLKFSIDLATEFSNTVNQFTLVCSKIVQNRMVDKQTSDKVYNLMGKIKDLLDAAGKTE